MGSFSVFEALTVFQHETARNVNGWRMKNTFTDFLTGVSRRAQAFRPVALTVPLTGGLPGRNLATIVLLRGPEMLADDGLFGGAGIAVLHRAESLTARRPGGGAERPLIAASLDLYGVPSAPDCGSGRRRGSGSLLLQEAVVREELPLHRGILGG